MALVTAGVGMVQEEAKKLIIQRIKDVYTYVKNYKVNIRELREKYQELLDQEAFINRKVEIGEQQLKRKTEPTENWLKEVKDLREDAKIKELMDEDNRKAKDVCCCFSSGNFTYRYFASEAAVEKRKQIDLTISRVPKGEVTLGIDVADLESTPAVFLDGLKSREDLVLKILKMLEDDNVYSVGIYGMGAVGKTTLAKEVKKKGNDVFARILMAEISELPNIDRIQEQLAESIGMSLDGYHTTVQRADRLCTRLKQVNAKGSTDEKAGKILIIMDNIWKRLDLGEVGIPFEQTKECCCKILFTSRQEDVCTVMGVHNDNVVPITLLTEKEAEYMFRTRVGEIETGVGLDYKTLEDRLLKKCGGLPLAIAATANALRGKSFAMWHRFANELESSQPANGLRGTYTILEISFNWINDEEKKKFFLLVCLFPLGSKILIEEMMRYGIGISLFQYVNKLSDAIELAKSWVDELRSSSLLWEDTSHEYVKIHDLVRESAISFAAKDGQKIMVGAAPRWLCKETLAKYTAITMSYVNDYSCVRGLKSDMLEMLRLEGDAVLKPYDFEDDFFEGMTNLKVLHLKHMNFEQGLPKSIAKLKDLKTLMLEDCKMCDIKLVGELDSLLVLSFKGSRIDDLPEEIGNLRKLRLLDLGNCYIGGERTLLAGSISRLSRLEGLFMSDSFKKWADVEVGSSHAGTTASEETGKILTGQNDNKSLASVSELNLLSCLNVLEMHIPNTTQLPNSGQFVENLNKFRIYVGSKQQTVEDKPSPSPLKVLPQLSRALVIRHMDLNQVLNYIWLKVLLKKTEFLELDGICGLKYLAHGLQYGDFKDLKHLHVERCDEMQCIIDTKRIIAMPVLPNLKSLFLSSIKNLKIICDGIATPGMFSNLQDVSLKSLAGLDTHALPRSFACRLTSIEVEDCQNLNFIFLGNASDREDELCTTAVLPSLKKLILRDLPKLRTLFVEAGSLTVTDHSQVLFSRKILLPSLEKLEISNLPIRQLWGSTPYGETCTTGDALAIDTNENNISYFKSLRKLDDIKIESCNNLESLGPPSVAARLLQLDMLKIKNCRQMSQLLTGETHGEIRERCIIVFPRLRVLWLSGLENLKSLYGGDHQLQFVALKKLLLDELPSIVSIAVSGKSTAFFNEKLEFPCLEELSMWSSRGNVGEEKELWHPLVAEGISTPISIPVPQLRLLELTQNTGLRLNPAIAFPRLSTVIMDDDNIKFVFPNSTQMPELEKLEVSGELIEGLLENENDVAGRKICGQLKALKLWYIKDLKPMPWHLFHNLRSLEIVLMNLECLFTSETVTRGIAQLFPLLEELRIEYCEEMKIVLDDKLGTGEHIPPQVIEFPRLKLIKLWSTYEATSFHSRAETTLHFPSLEELDLKKTYLKSLFPGDVIAPKLTTVRVEDCSELTTLFNVINLPSMQSLKIIKCPVLHSFSIGPLEAPLFNQVSVDDSEYLIEHMDLFNHPINMFLSEGADFYPGWKKIDPKDLPLK